MAKRRLHMALLIFYHLTNFWINWLLLEKRVHWLKYTKYATIKLNTTQ